MRPLGPMFDGILRQLEEVNMTQQQAPMLSSGKRKRYQGRPLDRQYAQLCALGDPKRYQERYERALEDFVEVLRIEGIVEIGIDWNTMSLVIGTECICVLDDDAQSHRLGHYVLTLTQRPNPAYKVHNTTPIRNGEAIIAHPHAMQDSAFCMSNKDAEIKLAITDGTYSVALRILMTALYMRKGTVTRGTPYHSGLVNWPILKE